MRVKIKEWKDMEAEFGLTPEESIDCGYVWTYGMEDTIPEHRIIEVEVSEKVPALFWQYWRISEDIIEAYLD